MAKPNATKPTKAAAPSTKAGKRGSNEPAPRDGKHAKPVSNAAPAKNGSNAATKPTGKDKKPAAASTPFSVPASDEVTAVVLRMNEKGLQWFQSIKPLKAAAEPVAAVASTSKRAKHKQQQQHKPLDETKPHALTEPQVQDKKRHAQRLLEAEVRRHESKKSGKLSSDDKYLATMMSKGTLSDRVAALTLTIQGAPFHSLTRLGQLITMATKKARRESMMAVESLKDLFINNLLPDDRKLNFFHQNPLDHASVTDAHLVLWFYEHCLKTAFAQLVGTLSAGMADAVDNHKRACIRAANALLAAKPEQEAVMLGMLVNKIGDPDRKIAAYIHKTLQELLKEHPMMKRVVVDEVERLLTRTQVSDRTKYNAVLFLNQIMLRKDDDDDAALATHLIKVFFALFSKEVHGAEEAEKKRQRKAQHKAAKKAAKGKSAALSKEGGSMDRKLLSALLMGVNRAFPYSRTATSSDLHDEIDTLFKVVRLAKHFATSVHAMMLLFQVMNATNSVSDRFYTALYEKLFDPKVRETSKHTLFLNLVFKALKADVSPARSSAFVKRLLQLTSVMTPAFTCAVLFLLSEVMKLKPQLRTLFDQPEAAGANKDDEHFTDKDSESEDKLNVFNPNDEEEDDEEEEDKGTEENDENDNDAELPEALNDGVSDADRTARVLAEMFGSSAGAAPDKPRAAKSFDDQDTAVTITKATTTESVYDWRKRNPLYAGAESSCAWEIHHLLSHYHPSVQQFARQLVASRNGGGIQYAGDPLVDFTMHAFFEKFMNKKPRHKQQTQLSQLQRDESGESGKNWTFVPINTEAVLQEAEDSIDISDQFFYKFFKERAQRDAANPNYKKSQQKKKAKRSGHDGDVFSGDDDDSEDDEVEAFAQQLAEGIMQDGDMDDEDPDLDDWSGPEDGEEEEEEEEDEEGGLDGEDDDDEAMAFGEGGEEDDDDEDELDGGDEDEGDEDEGDEEDDDDDDGDEGFDFDAMDGELDLPKVAKQKTPPTASKKKSMFADADDYEQIMRDALAKQKQQTNPKKRKNEGDKPKEKTKVTAKPKMTAKKSRKH